MPATSRVPSLSEIEGWDTEHLEAAATHWTATADTWDNAFTRIELETLYLDGGRWQGAAADAAALRVGLDRRLVTGAVDGLHSAARAARFGAYEITGARQLALQAVQQAEAAGFAVAEDLSVNDRQFGGLAASWAARQAAARAFADTVRARAVSLFEIDEQVAREITAAIAVVNTVQFAEPPVGTGPPQIQLVDRKLWPAPGPTPGDGASPGPVPTAQNIQDAVKNLPTGTREDIRLVRDPAQLRQLQDWVTQHSTEYTSDNPYRGGQGIQRQLADGTIVRFGPSGRHGLTSDITIPDDKLRIPGGEYIKIHVNPQRGGNMVFPEGAVEPLPPIEKPPPASSVRPPPPEPLPGGSGAPRGSITGGAGSGRAGMGGGGGFVRPFPGVKPPLG